MTKAKTKSLEMVYSGTFPKPLLSLMSKLPELSEALFEALSPYGIVFNSLRVEGTNLPEANLTYSFFNYAALVRVKLDRFEMNFFRLHEIGGEVANRAFVDAWRAMEKVVPGIRLAEHSVTATAFLAFPQSSLSEVALKFIQPPESF